MFKKIIIVLSFLVLIFCSPQLVFAADKRIVISLANQRLYAYQDNQLLYNFLISSGKWHPTPTGVFYPKVKLPIARMTGGDKSIGTFYDIPDVPNVVYFANDQIPVSDGYSIHGAYWHHNFGHPMSHGCINVRPDQMALLYPWIDYSTSITIQ